MHQGGADGGDREDLAGEPDLLDERGVADDRRGRPPRALENSVHASSPARKKTAKSSTPFGSSSWNTIVNTTRYIAGFRRVHTNPRTLFLYLTLSSLRTRLRSSSRYRQMLSRRWSGLGRFDRSTTSRSTGTGGGRHDVARAVGVHGRGQGSSLASALTSRQWRRGRVEAVTDPRAADPAGHPPASSWQGRSIRR